MSEEQDKGFKVSDRRLFNPDGSPRDDAPEEKTTPVISQTAQPAPAVRPEEIYAANSAAQLAPEPSAFAEAENIADEAEQEMTEFIQFLYSLASSTTFIHLGLMEHPATGKPEVDLEAAQEGIGLLILLREKTKGNLTRSEEAFFENLMADLKMQFVSLRG